MLSPTEGFIEKLVARVLVEAQPFKAVSLHIFNPGNTALTTKEGVIAGFLQPAKALQPTESSAQPELNSSSSPTVPQHLKELHAQSSTLLSVEGQPQLVRLVSNYRSVFSTGPNDLAAPALCNMTL
ncbi:Hypothetical protein SMAX5B_004623 [Scophthalmus maximus]|uniref:Uncharacterized protein n=1 Tax=Scophthalmus maximus TaxID=52904 RepID=A0A2U9CKK4_SCOMX|nr:Hypothetical protein SMAX5B_004623 [Scophthalmus maximus]KAF0024925.1 hypothetical protein F2P81_021806 [Scophthalmus maximus]